MISYKKLKEGTLYKSTDILGFLRKPVIEPPNYFIYERVPVGSILLFIERSESQKTYIEDFHILYEFIWLKFLDSNSKVIYVPWAIKHSNYKKYKLALELVDEEEKANE